jgi:hypothetical protein
MIRMCCIGLDSFHSKADSLLSIGLQEHGGQAQVGWVPPHHKDQTRKI